MVTIDGLDSSTDSSASATFDLDRQRAIVRRAIARHSYLTLATSSAANRPHVAGVLYAEADGVLYVSTYLDSVKARNVVANNRVALCIPVRKVPFAPPFAVQFQGVAELLPIDDWHVAGLAAAGRIKKITSHGELDVPGGCFLRITPTRRVVTYGLGVPLLTVLRDPFGAVRSVDMGARKPSTVAR